MAAPILALPNGHRRILVAAPILGQRWILVAAPTLALPFGQRWILVAAPILALYRIWIPACMEDACHPQIKACIECGSQPLSKMHAILKSMPVSNMDARLSRRRISGSCKLLLKRVLWREEDLQSHYRREVYPEDIPPFWRVDGHSRRRSHVAKNELAVRKCSAYSTSCTCITCCKYNTIQNVRARM